MPSARTGRRAAAKKVAATRRETATEKAKRLEAELAGLRGEIQSLVEENRDQLCETGLKDAAERLKVHGVDLRVGYRYQFRVDLHLTADGMENKLQRPYGGAMHFDSDIEAEIVSKLTDALEGFTSSGVEITHVDHDLSEIVSVDYA